MRHFGYRFKKDAKRLAIGAVCKVMQRSPLAQATPNPLTRRREIDRQYTVTTDGNCS